MTMAMDTARTQLVKFVAMPRRNKGRTEAEFHDWWSRTLAPSVIPFLTRHNIIKYTQVRAPNPGEVHQEREI